MRSTDLQHRGTVVYVSEDEKSTRYFKVDNDLYVNGGLSYGDERDEISPIRALDLIRDEMILQMPPGRAVRLLQELEAALPTHAADIRPALQQARSEFMALASGDEVARRAQLTLLVSTGGDRQFAKADEFRDVSVEREDVEGYAFYATPSGELVKIRVDDDEPTRDDWRPLEAASFDELVDAVAHGHAKDGNGVALVTYAAQLGKHEAAAVLQARLARPDISYVNWEGGIGDKDEKPAINDEYWRWTEGAAKIEAEATRFASLGVDMSKFSTNREMSISI
jgi:hypothetical protein